MKPAHSIGRIAVLGAGYMGSAITFPLAENHLDVRLWGTWLDDEIVESCRAGNHPKLKKRLPETVSIFGCDDLPSCLESVDCVILAITSEGFSAVFEKLLPLLSEDVSLMAVTKGFVETGDRVERISSWAFKRYRDRFPVSPFRWISIGGPVKAVELAYFVPTASVYGASTSVDFPLSFSTDYYRVHLSRDVVGVELCSALKNVYAMAAGICNGLSSSWNGSKNDNLKALVFSHAVEEMIRIVVTFGGKRDTVTGFAGVGDLFVTAQSGRNRRFGELVGSGMKPREAYRHMRDEGEVAEGYRTLELALRFLRQAHGEEIVGRDRRAKPPEIAGRDVGEGLLSSLALLATLERIVIRENSPGEEIRRFVKITNF